MIPKLAEFSTSWIWRISGISPFWLLPFWPSYSYSWVSSTDREPEDCRESIPSSAALIGNHGKELEGKMIKLLARTIMSAHECTWVQVPSCTHVEVKEESLCAIVEKDVRRSPSSFRHWLYLLPAKSLPCFWDWHSSSHAWLLGIPECRWEERRKHHQTRLEDTGVEIAWQPAQDPKELRTQTGKLWYKQWEWNENRAKATPGQDGIF